MESGSTVAAVTVADLRRSEPRGRPDAGGPHRCRGGAAVVRRGWIPSGPRRWRWWSPPPTSSGAARGAYDLACDYAKVREQYGKTIGSYQAVAHLLAESLVLIEGSISILRYAAWAVDEEEPAGRLEAAPRSPRSTARESAHTICETSIQVHGGIGNTWECLAHVYLRRVLVSTELWPVSS